MFSKMRHSAYRICNRQRGRHRGAFRCTVINVGNNKACGNLLSLSSGENSTTNHSLIQRHIASNRLPPPRQRLSPVSFGWRPRPGIGTTRFGRRRSVREPRKPAWRQPASSAARRTSSPSVPSACSVLRRQKLFFVLFGRRGVVRDEKYPAAGQRQHINTRRQPILIGGDAPIVAAILRRLAEGSVTVNTPCARFAQQRQGPRRACAG